MGDENDSLPGIDTAERRHRSTPRHSSIDEIREFDARFCEITKGLPIRTGSISRVPSDAYSRWGIEVTPENRTALAEMAEAFRRKDYEDRRLYGPTSQYEDTPFTNSTKTNLARVIGKVVMEIMKSLDDGARSFKICDLAPGRGRASTAIATALRGDRSTWGILSRTTFNLVDYSDIFLPNARASLEHFQPEGVRAHSIKDEDFLVENGDQFDVVVSLCHFHKKPFPDVYGKVFSALREGGVLVSGDWHSSICNHPSNIYHLFEKMRIETRRLDMFGSLMGDLLDPVSCPHMTMDQLKSIDDHQIHWADVYDQIIHSPAQVVQPRIYVLGAFDTTLARQQKLENAGFKTDPDTIAKAFPRARLPALPKTDHAWI